MFDAAYRSLTYSFRIRTALPDVALRIDELLAPFRLESGNGIPTFEIRRRGRTGIVRVYLDGGLVLRAASEAAALDYVLWRASRETIDRAEDFLVLHAGAVSWRGRAVVLPAPPDSGKTTLTAALTRAGLRYLTDEASFLELGSGRLHPFPRPLWMETGTLTLMPDLRDTLPPFITAPRINYHIDPADLRPRAIGSPCHVRYVVFPTYLRGAATALEPVSRAESIVALAENSFNAQRLGARGVRLLGDVVSGAECYRLVMGDLVSAVEAVLNLVKEGRSKVG